mgnify:CR=1 FL=1
MRSNVSIHQLSEEDQGIIYRCLVAALKGPFFPDWEFQTLFGINRDALDKVVEDWPNVDETNDDAFLAINNSFVNLLYYPHDSDQGWDEYNLAPRQTIEKVFHRWKALSVGEVKESE